MSDDITVAYVIAAYNEAASLPETIPQIVERLTAMPGSEVIIVENGSSDTTAEVAAGLAQQYAGGPVPVRHETSPKGLGTRCDAGWRSRTPNASC